MCLGPRESEISIPSRLGVLYGLFTLFFLQGVLLERIWSAEMCVMDVGSAPCWVRGKMLGKMSSPCQSKVTCLLKCDHFCFMRMSEAKAQFKPDLEQYDSWGFLLQTLQDINILYQGLYYNAVALNLLIASSVSPKVPICEVYHEHKNGIIFPLHFLY